MIDDAALTHYLLARLHGHSHELAMRIQQTVDALVQAYDKRALTKPEEATLPVPAYAESPVSFSEVLEHPDEVLSPPERRILQAIPEVTGMSVDAVCSAIGCKPSTYTRLVTGERCSFAAQARTVITRAQRDYPELADVADGLQVRRYDSVFREVNIANYLIDELRDVAPISQARAQQIAHDIVALFF